MIPDDFIRLQSLHEGTSDEVLDEDELYSLIRHEHPGVRGLLLCMHRDGEIELPASIIDEIKRTETDPLNRDILETTLNVSNNVENVVFPKFNK